MGLARGAACCMQTHECHAVHRYTCTHILIYMYRQWTQVLELSGQSGVGFHQLLGERFRILLWIIFGVRHNVKLAYASEGRWKACSSYSKTQHNQVHTEWGSSSGMLGVQRGAGARPKGHLATVLEEAVAGDCEVEVGREGVGAENIVHSCVRHAGWTR